MPGRKTKEAQRLYDYINGISDRKARLRALIALNGFYTQENSSFYTAEELAEYNALKESFFFPEKQNANGQNVLDTDAFPQAVALAGELSDEYVHDKYGMNLQVQDYLNTNPTTRELTAEQKKAAADYYSHNFAVENIKAAEVTNFLNGLGHTGRAQQFNEEARRRNAPQVETIISNRARAAEERLGARVAALQNYDLNLGIQRLAGTGIDPAKGAEISALLAADAKQGAPWMSDRQKTQYHVHALADHGLQSEISSYDCRNKLQSLSFLYDKMQKDMWSIGRDSKEYKELMGSLRGARELLSQIGDRDPQTWLAENADARRTMNNVMNAAGKYVQTHLSKRSSTLGENRFDAAMAALGIVNNDVAHMVAHDVNNFRRRENKPQSINMEYLSEKFGIAMDSPVHYNGVKHIKAIRADQSLDMNQVQAKRVKSNFLTDWNKIVGVTAEERDANLAELESLGAGTGLIHQHEADRVSNNIMAYMYIKHPELKGKLMEDLKDTDIYNGAANEYKEFLKANKVFEADPQTGSPVLLPNSEEKLANLANYHHEATRNISGHKLPDLSNASERRLAVENLFEQYPIGINLIQNEEMILGKTNEYLNQYPGKAEGYLMDAAKANAIGLIAKAAQQVDDPNLTLQERLGAKIFFDHYHEQFTGKTTGELVESGVGSTLVSAYPILVGGMMEFEAEDEHLKAACEAYLAGKGPMPQELREFVAEKTEDWKAITEAQIIAQKAVDEKVTKGFREWQSNHLIKNLRSEFEKGPEDAQKNAPAGSEKISAGTAKTAAVEKVSFEKLMETAKRPKLEKVDTSLLKSKNPVIQKENKGKEK